MAESGVTPALASLLLAVIVVAAVVVTYVWVSGYLGSIGSGVEAPQFRELLKVESVRVENGIAVVTLRNVGGAKAALRAVYVMKGGVAVASDTCLNIVLEPGQTADLNIDVRIPPGEYLIKVVTATGVEAVAPLPLSGVAQQPAQRESTLTISVEPRFTITSWSQSVEGSVGSEQRFVVVVKNVGGVEGVVEVKVLDHGGSPVTSVQLTVPPCQQVTAELTITLPPARGAYEWSVTASDPATGEVHDSRVFTVRAMDLYLKMRSALCYTGFEALPSGWNSIGGSWSAASEGFEGNALQGVDNDEGPGKTSLYHWSNGISSYSDLRSIVQVKASGALEKLGLALLADTGSFYTVDLDYTGKDRTFEILYYDGEWRAVSGAAYKPSVGTWYAIYLEWSRCDSDNVFSAVLYDASGNQLASIAASHSAPTLAYVGLVVDGKGKGLFDNFVLAAGDPRYVTVSGLQQGWLVELRSASGDLIASAVAGNDGVAHLSVIARPVIADARIAIRDARGNTVIEKTFSEVFGGDEYAYGS